MKENTQGMTIEKLENYRGLVAEMHSLSESINSLYDTYKSPQFCRNGGSHSNNVWSPVESAVEKILKLKDLYDHKYSEAANLLLEVEAWLSTVDDPEIRSIVRFHYVLNKSWVQTSTEVYGFPSYYNSRKKIMRYFGRKK
jgi:hypothetical protein